MAVIVRHLKTEAEYILLGGGFGVFKGMRPSPIGGALFPHEESGKVPVALVCDAEGAVDWMRSDNLEVLSVDGRSPSEVLSEEVV